MKTKTIIAILSISIILVGACASPSPVPTTSLAATETPASPTTTTQDATSASTTTSVTPQVTTTKPTLTPILTPARDLTGTWRGSGAYYYMDNASGQRVVTVTIELTLRIAQNDGTAVVNMDQRVTKQEPAGTVSVKDANGNERYALLPAEDWNGALQGTVSVTTLTLVTTNTIGYTDQWQFTFTTDLMSGGVIEQITGGAPYECKSDPKAFVLTRQEID